jgi:pimeloyl-ACP methyl ester carboxylesterase
MPGDCSRIEEAGDLIPAILQTAAAQGKKATVISFDMIGWGYSAQRAFDSSGNIVLFDQTLFPIVTHPANPPALQFVENFVVALLEALNIGPPFIDLNRVVPIGGSLGGNLALRLGRRSDLSWLKAVCGWSAASVWPSKATYPDTGTTAAMVRPLALPLGLSLARFSRESAPLWGLGWAPSWAA